MKRLYVLVVVGLLGGCTSVASDTAGTSASLGVGAAVGAATANPLIGLAAGLAATVAIDAGLKYAERELTLDRHNAIAEPAGAAPLGEWRPWVMTSRVSGVGDASGRLLVTREFADPPCREIVYTDDVEDPEFYVAMICRNHEGQWRWAVSEPATPRWGFLQ